MFFSALCVAFLFLNASRLILLVAFSHVVGCMSVFIFFRFVSASWVILLFLRGSSPKLLEALRSEASRSPLLQSFKSIQIKSSNSINQSHQTNQIKSHHITSHQCKQPIKSNQIKSNQINSIQFNSIQFNSIQSLN